VLTLPCDAVPLRAVFVQIIAACYALSLDLRLQVLWSAKSAIIPGGYNVDAMCRCVGHKFYLKQQHCAVNCHSPWRVTTGGGYSVLLYVCLTSCRCCSLRAHLRPVAVHTMHCVIQP
jgi:hypothetical protein